MRSRKIIKKILQITALLLILMFAMPATAFLLLQNTNIQTGVVNQSDADCIRESANTIYHRQN